MKIILNFDSLSEIEKEWFLKNTWCDICRKADLGITKPELYLDNGMKYISGKCNVCGAACVSKITEKILNTDNKI